MEKVKKGTIRIPNFKILSFSAILGNIAKIVEYEDF
jgi:hypothetical protein